MISLHFPPEKLKWKKFFFPILVLSANERWIVMFSCSSVSRITCISRYENGKRNLDCALTSFFIWKFENHCWTYVAPEANHVKTLKKLFQFLFHLLQFTVNHNVPKELFWVPKRITKVKSSSSIIRKFFLSCCYLNLTFFMRSGINREKGDGRK